ncbi:MAG: glycoside hydrolase family 88 protein, partial [Prevotella sp.]|nr:glycoside hydrolase family 88 protein [Bacteroidales bacterium]MDY5877555.1 glycoside hydrolase family 88 protein [Prevotella sp.]
MNNFYANTTECGFAVYDQNGNQTADLVDKKGKLDYVVGLVAKSIIEASQYYSQFEWAESFAKPWFLSIKNYGDNFYSKFSTSGGSLDDLNAVKLFIPLRAMTATDGKYPTTTTYGYTTSALNNAIKGLKAHNDTYSIGTGTLAETAGNTVAGGWWHKSIYQNQMWLDGAYMGPALFAELVNYSGTTTNIDSSNDWDLIVKQFTILRNMCWNENAQLPYHAFAADGGTNTTSHSNTWAGLSHSEPYVFHSASYWGRAVGWYFLALVDILEQMDKANLSSSNGYTTLKGYLAETADGLKARQDQATGGWYQILDEDGTYSASEYNNGQSHTTTNNYIESSATALFTAAYLKAIRKKYLDETTYKTVAENGYKCLINQFFSVDENGKVNIFGSCRSAGLGGKGDPYKAGNEKFRDGSKPYYLLGYDVARVDKSEKKTEGKVLGA